MRIVDGLRNLNYEVWLDSGSIRFKSKTTPPPAGARDLLLRLRARKADAIRFLSLRWPQESLVCEAKFRHGAPRLYPLLGQAVSTPKGVGRLWQVGSELVGVVLESRPDAVSFLQYDSILPLTRPGLEDLLEKSSP